MRIEYLSSYNHRANKADRTIRDFKNDFIETLGKMHSSIPLALWDGIISQVNSTVNRLCPFGSQLALLRMNMKAPWQAIRLCRQSHGHMWQSSIGTRIT